MTVSVLRALRVLWAAMALAMLTLPWVSKGAELNGPGLTQEYFTSFFLNGARLVTSPLVARPSSWLQNALALGIVGGLYVLDDDVRDAVQRNRTPTLDHIADNARVFGAPGGLLPALGLTYVAGVATDSPRAKETALLGFESWTLTAVGVGGLQLLTRRHRPDEGLGKHAFDGPSLSSKADSFPSGHASSAFAVATIVALEYRDTPGVPLVSYGLATLAGWSRVNDDKHWASDVFLGSAIGYGVAQLVFASDPFLRRHDIALAPLPSADAAGLALRMQF